MTYQLIVRPQTEKDLLSAFDWYEEKLEGLGYEFIIELDKLLSIIYENPLIYQKIYKDVRRAMVRRFPYCLYYIVSNNRISIIAVLHGASSPQKWRRRASPDIS